MAIATAQKWMDEALTLAKQAASLNEVPVGAIIVKNNEIIGRGHNRTIIDHDPCGHAEIIAIREAAIYLKNSRLNGCDIWVTLEPCAMCAGAISHARLNRVYYAANDPKGGAIASGPTLFNQDTIHHKPEIYSGIRADKSAAMLKDFFRSQRS